MVVETGSGTFDRTVRDLRRLGRVGVSRDVPVESRHDTDVVPSLRGKRKKKEESVISVHNKDSCTRSFEGRTLRVSGFRWGGYHFSLTFNSSTSNFLSLAFRRQERGFK